MAAASGAIDSIAAFMTIWNICTLKRCPCSCYWDWQIVLRFIFLISTSEKKNESCLIYVNLKSDRRIKLT